MIVFRITRLDYYNDLSGTGAKMTGGRWNPKGFSLIYTSSTSSLSILEKLVHVDADLLPGDLVVTEIEIDDSAIKQKITAKDLPKNWNTYPSPDVSREIGRKWLIESKSLILIVPSVINPKENNILINPQHHQIERVKILNHSPFNIDPRLRN